MRAVPSHRPDPGGVWFANDRSDLLYIRLDDREQDVLMSKADVYTFGRKVA